MQSQLELRIDVFRYHLCLLQKHLSSHVSDGSTNKSLNPSKVSLWGKLISEMWDNCGVAIPWPSASLRIHHPRRPSIIVYSFQEID